jgi:hypothetical protein
VKRALAVYEAVIEQLARGDASIIAAAGLPSRGPKAPPAALGEMGVVRTRQGALPAQAVLTWPEVTGATSYAIELNPTPQSPAGPWNALGSGSRRRRLVSGPAPGAQILARVAALGSNGTQSAWSDPVLVTLR